MLQLELGRECTECSVQVDRTLRASLREERVCTWYFDLGLIFISRVLTEESS